MRDELRQWRFVDEQSSVVEDPSDLSERRVRVVDVIARSEIDDDVELAVGERQIADVPGVKLRPDSRAGDACPGQSN